MHCLLEVKSPGPFQSRLDIWRAQAQVQSLGVSYIVFQHIKQQPIGWGIPVLKLHLKRAKPLCPPGNQITVGMVSLKFGLNLQGTHLKFQPESGK